MVPLGHAYEVYIFQLMRESRARVSYYEFLNGELLNQWCIVIKLRTPFQKLFAMEYLFHK